MKALIFALLLCLPLTSARAETGDTHLGVSGPLTLISGSAFWGAGATVLHEVTPKWWVGGSTGFYYWSVSYGSLTTSEWFVPLVPTVYYNVDVGTPTFHPFFGLGLGIAYIHYSSPNLGGYPAYSGSSVKFDGMLHAGAKFGKKRRFFADVGLGIIDGSFALAPQIGWFFSL